MRAGSSARAGKVRDQRGQLACGPAPRPRRCIRVSRCECETDPLRTRDYSLDRRSGCHLPLGSQLTAASIPSDDSRGAGAGAPRVAKVAAGTGVHRGDQDKCITIDPCKQSLNWLCRCCSDRREDVPLPRLWLPDPCVRRLPVTPRQRTGWSLVARNGRTPSSLPRFPEHRAHRA
jgi:hypothetical protein